MFLGSLCLAQLAGAQTFATLPFSETFESGVLQSFWVKSGTGPYRGQVTTANVPHGGVYHYTMDGSSQSVNERNELTLGLNLAGYTNVVLSFWAKGFLDEANGPPPTPFVTGFDFDGVAISQDGVNWYEVQGLRNLTTNYVEYVVSLDAAVAAFGLTYNSTFRIRFNQFDNFPIQASSSDGIGLDDISITGGLAGELDHFKLSSVPTPQLVNAPFPVTITAVDAANNPVSSFNGSVNLSGQPGSVPVNPPTADLVNGSWSGSVAMGQAISNVRLLAQATVYSGQGNSFTVLATNDLALTASSPGATVAIGTGLAYQFNVVNAGPAAASGVIVSNILAPGVTFASFTPGQGDYALFGQTLRWNLGTVAAGTNIAASLVVIPTSGGFLTNSATLSRTGPDADPSNNSVILTNQAAALGVLSVTPANGLTSTGGTGGPFAPSNQVYVISNAGSATLTFSVVRSATWLTPSPLSGSLGPGDSTTLTLRVNANANTLQPGTWLETVLLTNTTSGLGSTARFVSLTVATNQRPVTSSFGLSTPENTAITVTIPGSDPDGDPLRGNITFLPLSGRLFQTPDGAAFGAPITTNDTVVSNSLRKVIYLPATNTFGNGIGSIFYNVSDGRTNSAGGAVSIDVTPANQPPVAVPDEVSAIPGFASSVFVLFNDFDPENDSFTLNSYTTPALGTLTPQGGGQFSYMPNPGVVKGTDQFTYTIIDDFNRTASAKVTIHIGYLSGGDWPTLGKDPQHTGYYPSSKGTNLFSPIWTNIYTGTLNQVATADGMVFVTMSSGVPYLSMIAALDARTGGQLWRNQFAGANSITAPTFDNGRVYFQRSNHEPDTHLRCLDANTGAILWVIPYGAQWDWSLAPLVVGDGVWIAGGTYGGMYGYDTATGGKRFFNDWGNLIEGWTPTYYKGTVYSWYETTFHASDPVYGTDAWVIPAPGGPSYPDSMNAAAVIQSDRAVLMANTYLDCIDLNSQSIAWANPGSFGGMPATRADTVYCIASGSPSSQVNAYDLASGSLLGSYVATNDTGLTGQVIVTDDCLLVASSSKTYIYDLVSHQLVQTLPYGGSISLADGNLYVAAYTYLRAYTLAVPTPSNDVSIAFSPLPTNTLVLQPLTYTLTITNPGPNTATGLNVTNFLTSGVTITNAVASQGSCTNYTNGVSANLGSLVAGAFATVSVTIVPNTGGNLLATAQVTTTSTDPDLSNNRALAATLAVPQVSVTDIFVTKPSVGTTIALFTISLAAPSSQTITVNYATTNGTATNGIDYLGQSGTMTFAPGVTTQSLPIVINGNTVPGPNEDFFVNLSAPANAAVLTTQTRCTILNSAGLPGQVHHFEWNPIASPRIRGEPFAVTVTAKDASNQVVSNYTGAVTLALKLGGWNFDFENATLLPWTNLAPSSTPYQLVQFDVAGGNFSSQAVRFKPNSGGGSTGNGVSQSIPFNARLPYTLEADWAMVNESGSENGADSAQLVAGGSTIASTNLTSSRIGAGVTFRGHLRGNYTPIAVGNSTLTASFTRGFLAVELWSYFDNVSLTFPKSSTNYFPYNLTFSNGLWSGPLTIQQPAASAFLVADDGNGHLGSSTFFAVLTNHPPIVDSQTFVINEDTSQPITLTASDADADPLTFGLALPPTNGIVTGSGPNLTYTPNTNYWGADKFFFFVNDGKGNSVTSYVAMTVVAVTDLGYSRLSSQGTNGQLQLSLLGEPYEHYQIEASQDLVHWTLVTNLIPTNGALPFIDPQAASYSYRFYRGVLVGAAPQLSSAHLVGGQFQFSLGAAVGRRCEVSASTDLVQWTPLTNLVMTEPAFLVTDPAAANFSHRFYRARLLP